MRILIKGTNWIGDAVMSMPSVRSIRAAFPDAFIALHTRRWAEDVFSDSGLFDEIISFEPSGSRMRTVIDQARIIRKGGFDAAVLFPNSFESALTLAFAGIPRRFGYRTEGRRILLTDSLPVPEWKSKRHESKFYSELAKFFVISMGGSESRKVAEGPLLKIADEKRRAAVERLRAAKGSSAGLLIGIGAGSTNSMAKRWPVENFARLCDLLADRLGARFVLLGSPNESDVGAALDATASAEICDLTGKTNISEATAILSIVDLFVCNDMGLAHISGALGTPTLTLFGPTNEAATAPLGANARIIREVVECSPCMLRECPIDHRCMRRLLPERVFETAVKMLQNRATIQ